MARTPKLRGTEPPLPAPSRRHKCTKTHRTRNGGPACSAHTSRAGKCCTCAPLRGQRVCRAHGGASRKAKAAAAERLAVAAIHADAKAMLAHTGNEPLTDPLGELGKLANEILALKTAAGARVNALTDIRYTGGLVRDENGELIGSGTEQLRAEVALYERSIDRLMRALELLAKHTTGAGVAETRSMLADLWAAMQGKDAA